MAHSPRSSSRASLTSLARDKGGDLAIDPSIVLRLSIEHVPGQDQVTHI